MDQLVLLELHIIDCTNPQIIFSKNLQMNYKWDSLKFEADNYRRRSQRPWGMKEEDGGN